MDKEVLGILLSKSEMDCLKQAYWYNDDLSICNNNHILNFFSDNNISTLFDWAETDVESKMYIFLNYRLNQIGKTKLGSNEMYQVQTSYKFAKGERLQNILKYYNNILHKKGFSIVNLNYYSQKEDYYRIFIISESNIPRLIKHNSEIWDFKPLME